MIRREGGEGWKEGGKDGRREERNVAKRDTATDLTLEGEKGKIRAIPMLPVTERKCFNIKFEILSQKYEDRCRYAGEGGPRVIFPFSLFSTSSPPPVFFGSLGRVLEILRWPRDNIP